MVTIVADISLLAGSSGLKLELAPNSLMYKNEENACNRFSENPVVNLLLRMSLVILIQYFIDNNKKNVPLFKKCNKKWVCCFRRMILMQWIIIAH